MAPEVLTGIGVYDKKVDVVEDSPLGDFHEK
jgi:hypothetical protein